MSDSQSVLQYRVGRMRRAPRNWTYWIAFFTLLNCVFLSMGQDIVVLAGFVFPFLWDSAWPHFLAAISLAAFAYFSSYARALLFIALALYLADALLAGYLQLWAGLIMHSVVLAFIAIALSGARHLSKQLSPEAQGEEN